ncbi:MAG: asparagine synthase (glutamine-hydrolyzing) [Alsobacter sp.]
MNFPPEKRALDIVAHRGPDGEGWQELSTPAGPLALGHRRLAIIATDSSGLQPMWYGSDRYGTVFNGEIYNYLELRDELTALGYPVATKTDTEVLLASYACWGEACLSKFNGMFAFVIFDRVEQRLFVARDRFGVKPLYYWANQQGMAFASEIKQFAAIEGFSARLDERGAWDFLVSGVFDHRAETLFAGVRQIRGGECASIDLRAWSPGVGLYVRRWYALPRPDTLEMPIETAAARFLDLMRDSVRLRLRADVPVGTCLSGGLDSSTIVCLMSELIAADPEARQHTFTCAFDYPGLDELTYAQAVNEQCGTTSHVVSPSAEDLWSAIDDMIWHQDEPFGSTSIFAQWSVFAEARKVGVTVMLDGQGADEQLAGYHPMFGAALASHVRGLRIKRLADEIAAIRRRHRTSWERIVGLVLASLLPRGWFVPVLRMTGRKPTPLWLAPGFGTAHEGDLLGSLRVPRMAGASPLGALCSHQLTTTSVPMLLHFEDRNSMAHAIEARVPFLDYRIAELTISLGQANKVVDGETKALLRRAMEPILPQKVTNRQDKLGFPTPEEAWFKGPLRERVLSAVETSISAYPTIFAGEAVRTFARDMLDGRVPFSPALWRIICFGRWGQRFGVSA